MTVQAIAGKELFLTALKGGKVPRPAVFSADQTGTYELMEKVSAYWPEAICNAKDMAKLAATASTVLGFDAVRVPFCQTIEAEILGSILREGGRENVPSIKQHRYKIGDVPDFPEDFLSRGRIPELLEAVKILKDTLGDSAAVVGGIIGPFSIAGNIVDVTALLHACMKNPDSIIPYLEVAEKAGTMLGKALIDAGADAIAIGLDRRAARGVGGRGKPAPVGDQGGAVDDQAERMMGHTRGDSGALDVSRARRVRLPTLFHRKTRSSARDDHQERWR